MFYVGQKVVVIYDGPSFNCNKTVLKAGQVFTVAGYSGQPGVSYDGDILSSGLLLVELRPPEPNGFDPRRFRPVVDRKTDISVFTAMLNTKPARIDA